MNIRKNLLQALSAALLVSVSALGTGHAHWVQASGIGFPHSLRPEPRVHRQRLNKLLHPNLKKKNFLIA